MIRERTCAGLEAARARGRKGGRKPIPPDHEVVQAAQSLHKSKASIHSICRSLNISRTTLYRYLNLGKKNDA